MPHDQNGNLLRVGDQINVPAVITNICEGEEYCNVTLETIYPMYPGDSKSMWSAVNTRQTVKTPVNAAEVAYEAYRAHTGGKSLASGADIPTFRKMRPEIQAAWNAAVAALGLAA